MLTHAWVRPHKHGPRDAGNDKQRQIDITPHLKVSAVNVHGQNISVHILKTKCNFTLLI